MISHECVLNRENRTRLAPRVCSYLGDLHLHHPQSLSGVALLACAYVCVCVGLPWWLRWQRICLQCRRPGFNPWLGKIPWRREWQPTPVFLPGEFPGQRSLGGYSPWGVAKRRTQLSNQHPHTYMYAIGSVSLENSNTLPYSYPTSNTWEITQLNSLPDYKANCHHPIIL